MSFFDYLKLFCIKYYCQNCFNNYTIHFMDEVLCKKKQSTEFSGNFVFRLWKERCTTADFYHFSSNACGAVNNTSIYVEIKRPILGNVHLKRQ